MSTTAVGLGAEECPPEGVQMAGSRPVVAAQDSPHSAALM
jgi:hypothetical protein